MEISLTHRVFVRYRGAVFDRAREHGERPRRGLVPAPPQKSPLPRREGDWKHLSFFFEAFFSRPPRPTHTLHGPEATMRTVGQSNARRRARTLKPRGRRAKMRGGERKVLKDRRTTREEDHTVWRADSPLHFPS